MKDAKDRIYARLSELSVGSIVIVDDGFEGCFIPWSRLVVVEVEGELCVPHNVDSCGACGGSSDEFCPHILEGQCSDDEDGDDWLVGIYHATKEDFVT